VRVARGATIAITANPETPPGIAVPDLTNLRLGEARRLLQEAGLEAGRVRRRWDDRRGPDVVLSQEPAAGERVEAGTAIEITANEGV
jgi:serine/threonine-protein kinase